MKIVLAKLTGWIWIAVVLYLYVAQSPRLRPSGVLGSLLKSFFDAMAASYLN
jgi:hypothetical protein